MTSTEHFPSRTKHIAKAMLPKSWVTFIKGCRYRGFIAHVSYIRKFRMYRARFSRANAAAAEATIVLPANCRIQIPPEVREAFEHFGWRDPDMVDEFIGFMKASADRKILWDVGALYGTFSLAFTLAGAGRSALAFEPNPVSRAKLEECIHLNPAANITVFDSALGLPGELVEFESGFHYTAVAGLPARPDEQHLVQQQTQSIDGLIERNIAVPDAIKIDVEGHEFEVLQGARNLLSSKRPLLSVELHPGLLARKNTSALAIAQYLEQAGYAFYDTQLRRVKNSFFDRRDNFRIFAM